MINKAIRIAGITFFLTSVIISLNEVGAEDKGKMGGWGVHDPYHHHYQVDKSEKFKGKVLRIKEVIPMPGMSPGVAIDVKEDSNVIEVQICPTWFAKPDEIGIKKGDRVHIRGVRTNINNKEIFMASKIKKEDYFEIKVRFTKDGIPFWTMTPDEVFKEKRKKSESWE